MIINIFSVWDTAVGAYMQPFFSPTKGTAVRSLTEAVNDPKHEFNKNSKDYILFHLGSFDDATGLFTSDGPERLISCTEVIIKT